MAVNEVIPYWDLFEKPIINDSKTKYEHREIRKNYVNFINKGVNSWIFPSDSYVYQK